MKKLYKNKLSILLIIMLLIMVLYLSIPQIRCFLSGSNVDPNFIVGFLTAIALVITLIENNRDKRYSYNLRLGESIEEKGVRIISKLLTAKHAANVFSQVLLQYKESIKSGSEFRDANKLSNSSEDISGPDIELVAAFMEIYFPHIKEDWNTLMDKMTELATIHINVQTNYRENLSFVTSKVPFKNVILDDLDNWITKASELQSEIDSITQKIRDSVIETINKYKIRIKDNID